MGWLFKSKKELEQDQEAQRRINEEAQRERDEIKRAKATVFEYGDQLKFPTEVIDVRFYNHLFSILLDQQKRIEELERQIKTKD